MSDREAGLLLHHPTAWSAFLAGALLTAYHAVPWASVFLLTRLLGVRLYVLRDRAVCRRVQKRLPRSSHVADGGHGYGISVGRWYYASVSIVPGDAGDQYDVWMIATAASFQFLTADTPDADKGILGAHPVDPGPVGPPPASGEIEIFERTGSFHCVWFKRRKIAAQAAWAAPWPAQAAALDAVCAHHARHHHTVAYLHGPPGSGKSLVGIMLAARLGGAYCNSYLPWRPGDLLADVYAEAEPTARRPLVVALDEFDVALQAVHAGTLAPHKSIPIEVADKAGWNRLLDEVGRGMFTHLVLLLTSTRTPDFVRRRLDPSYIRAGRVDLELGFG